MGLLERRLTPNGKRPNGYWQQKQNELPKNKALCTRCNKVKRKESFQPHKWALKTYAGSQIACRACANAYSRKQYKQKGGYAAMIERHRRNAYGMHPGDYTNLIAKQHGACAVCGQPLDLTRSQGCHIDRARNTGTIRGLLCGPCHHGVAFIERTGLQNIINYLQSSSEPRH